MSQFIPIPRLMIALLFVVCFAPLTGIMTPAPAAAAPNRQQNLLQNPNFDAGVAPQAGIPGAVPIGWAAYGDFSESDKEELGALTRSAPYSWRLRKEYGKFTGGGYQTVAAQSGATYRFTIYALIWTCNDLEFACRNAEGTYSDTTSGGAVRVGIDPSGGTNPWAGSVVWSGFAAPFTWGSFAALSVEAKAAANQVTVFTYYTASQDMRWHDVFWDDASLVMTAAAGGNSGGTTNGGNNNSNNNTPRPQATAAPVSQESQTRPDGSQVHMVRPGQYLSTIAQAYNLTLNQLLALNPNLSASSIIRPGDEIIVKAATSKPTATPTTSLAQATVTPLVFPTALAQASTLTPTLAVVQVEQGDNAASPRDDATRSLVMVLAVGVITTGVVVMGGMVGFVGWMFLRRG